MMFRTKLASFAAMVVLSGLISASARAGETASATISSTPVSGGSQFTITLTNTSTDGSNIGTFWFSWIPGADYMQDQPTNVISPAGWSFNPTGSNNSTDGNAIQWLAGTGPLLTPGNTNTFSFVSAESLSQLESASPFKDHELETTAFVYSGATFSDAGAKIVVPEPASASLLIGGCSILMLRRRRGPALNEEM